MTSEKNAMEDNLKKIKWNTTLKKWKTTKKEKKENDQKKWKQ
jgi:hypothetical protein